MHLGRRGKLAVGCSNWGLKLWLQKNTDLQIADKWRWANMQKSQMIFPHAYRSSSPHTHTPHAQVHSLVFHRKCHVLNSRVKFCVSSLQFIASCFTLKSCSLVRELTCSFLVCLHLVCLLSDVLIDSTCSLLLCFVLTSCKCVSSLSVLNCVWYHVHYCCIAYSFLLILCLKPWILLFFFQIVFSIFVLLLKEGFWLLQFLDALSLKTHKMRKNDAGL